MASFYKGLCQNLEHPYVSSQVGRGSQSKQCDAVASSFTQSAGSVSWVSNLGPREPEHNGKMLTPWVMEGGLPESPQKPLEGRTLSEAYVYGKGFEKHSQEKS